MLELNAMFSEELSSNSLQLSYQGGFINISTTCGKFNVPIIQAQGGGSRLTASSRKFLATPIRKWMKENLQTYIKLLQRIQEKENEIKDLEKKKEEVHEYLNRKLNTIGVFVKVDDPYNYNTKQRKCKLTITTSTTFQSENFDEMLSILQEQSGYVRQYIEAVAAINHMKEMKNASSTNLQKLGLASC